MESSESSLPISVEDHDEICRLYRVEQRTIQEIAIQFTGSIAGMWDIWKILYTYGDIERKRWQRIGKENHPIAGRLYWEEGYTTEKVADVLGVGLMTAWKILKADGRPLRKPHGYPRTEKQLNRRQTLSNEQIRAIHAQGQVSMATIGKMAGISRERVRQICKKSADPGPDTLTSVATEVD